MLPRGWTPALFLLSTRLQQFEYPCHRFKPSNQSSPHCLQSAVYSRGRIMLDRWPSSSGRGLVDCTCRSQNGCWAKLLIGVDRHQSSSIGVKSPRSSLAPGATGAGEVSTAGRFAVVVIVAIVAVAAVLLAQLGFSLCVSDKSTLATTAADRYDSNSDWILLDKRHS